VDVDDKDMTDTDGQSGGGGSVSECGSGDAAGFSPHFMAYGDRFILLGFVGHLWAR
jgi:hypothetical protein